MPKEQSYEQASRSPNIVANINKLSSTEIIAPSSSINEEPWL